ncbi:MAG TPA: hypothetical protein VH415_14085 [Nitrososphaeraceae archaeon]
MALAHHVKSASTKSIDRRKRKTSTRKQTVQRRPEISAIFKALSDDEVLTSLNTIALSPGNSNFLNSNLGITRKPYYSKINHHSTRIVARKNGKYHDDPGKNNLRTSEGASGRY